MKKDIKAQLQVLLDEAMHFNTNDVLVDLQQSAKLIAAGEDLTYSLDVFPKRILKEAEQNRLESGIASMCLAEGYIEWLYKGRCIQTPVRLTPLAYEVKKISRQLKLELLNEESFINPFLLRVFNLDKDEFSDQQDFLDKLSGEDLTLNPSHRVIGNFHYHRFDVLRELDALIKREAYAPSLKSALGFDAANERISLPSQLLFPADSNHLEALKAIEEDHVLIQGPPGTGKSQTLANLAAKSMAASYATLFVSEKRAALEVIQKRLGQFGLDRLCFIAGGERSSTFLIRALRENFLFYESYQNSGKQAFFIAEDEERALQYTLDLLNAPDLISGVSLYEFLRDYPDNGLPAQYSNLTPALHVFRKHENDISFLYSEGLATVLSCIHPKLLVEDVDRITEKLLKIRSILNKLGHFELGNSRDLSQLTRLAIRSQVFENELYKKHSELYVPDSKSQKRFLKLVKELRKVELKLEKFQDYKSLLTPKLSLEALLTLQNTLSNDSGFYSRMKSKRLWGRISDLPLDLALPTVQQLIIYRKLEATKCEILEQFTDLNLLNPEKEHALILNSLHQYTPEEWIELYQLDPEKRLELTRGHRLLSELNQLISESFLFGEKDLIAEKMAEVEAKLPLLIVHKQFINKLDSSVFRLMKEAKDFNQYKNSCIESHRTRFKESFPRFASFNMTELENRINHIIQLQDQEAKVFAELIHHELKRRFDTYHRLLNTPASKLNAEEKLRKQELRKGKAILVREFSKSRQHKSIRELYHSEARVWIELLMPVWLSNPVQLARCFPLEAGLFDLVIFDESSQIPLANAVGAIERGKRMVVAGDEHQMGPASYFKANKGEPSSLLQQVMYYWKRKELQHHYRSVHGDLIAFSNKNFYQNALITFPEYGTKQVLFDHYQENGQFINRKNLLEAKALARLLRNLLPKKDSFGVVAFSEEQLLQIYQELSSAEQELLEERIEKRTCFFKALENVQGDECDHLLISFGFAKDGDGLFQMRFGPMNTQNGRRRLNVLLTRAIRSLHFFSSVRASDFKLSSNESVNLIRQWFLFLESHIQQSASSFPFDLQPEIHGQELYFRGVQAKLTQANELVTLHRVLRDRGWKVVHQ